MNFFDKMTSSISSAGRDVVKKVKDVTDASKYNSEIRESERCIQRLYEQIYMSIGEKYYRDHRDEVEDEYKDTFAEIKKHQDVITKKREELMKLNEMKRCVNCGSELPKGARFCNNCGAPVQEQMTPRQEGQCPVCGALLGEGNLFCTECGTRLPEKMEEKKENIKEQKEGET